MAAILSGTEDFRPSGVSCPTFTIAFSMTRWSPRISKNVDLPTLIDHQTKFITTSIGGPVNTPNEQLRRAHERLGVTQAEFRQIVDLLEETQDS